MKEKSQRGYKIENSVLNQQQRSEQRNATEFRGNFSSISKKNLDDISSCHVLVSSFIWRTKCMMAIWQPKHAPRYTPTTIDNVCLLVNCVMTFRNTERKLAKDEKFKKSFESCRTIEEKIASIWEIASILQLSRIFLTSWAELTFFFRKWAEKCFSSSVCSSSNNSSWW